MRLTRCVLVTGVQTCALPISLFIACLGFGIESKVALATYIATFSIIVGTAAGLHAADENARMLFKTMGASRWQALIKMKLPTGMPHFLTRPNIGAVGFMHGSTTGPSSGGGKGGGGQMGGGGGREK